MLCSLYYDGVSGHQALPFLINLILICIIDLGHCMQTLHVIHFTLSREMRCRPKADKIRELWLFLAAALFSLWGEYRLMHSALKIP